MQLTAIRQSDWWRQDFDAWHKCTGVPQTLSPLRVKGWLRQTTDAYSAAKKPSVIKKKFSTLKYHTLSKQPQCERRLTMTINLLTMQEQTESMSLSFSNRGCGYARLALTHIGATLSLKFFLTYLRPTKAPIKNLT